jgi:uncharacterized membrane protein YdjX (TVP38/TMEM64 family)
VSRLGATTRSGRTEWLRLSVFIAALLACVLVPFALWGDVLDRAAPQWLDAQDARLWIAVFGIALLIADVLLPVPSSVVAMGLCWSLGPVWGGISVAIGGLLAFATGYGIGRLTSEVRLRRWVGPTLWDRAREQARDRALWWIVFARPLPVLAEISALLAGVWRLPPVTAFASAAAASAMVGALYAACAWLGWQAPGIVPMLIAMSTLPTVMWIAHRCVMRGLLRKD